jgi:hypothetical protein
MCLLYVFTVSYVESTPGIVTALLTALPPVNEHEPEYIGGLLSKVMHGDSDSVAPTANTGIDITPTKPAVAISIASIAVLPISFLAFFCISISMVLVMIIVIDIVK